MKHYTIRCPNCGAPLKIVGGRNIHSITCEYCGSLIDLHENYKVLSKFEVLKNPGGSPFEVGMRGKIKGIEFIITGFVVYGLSPGSRSVWVDYSLYSPIYGYAWMTYEDGALSFSRRLRQMPSVDMNRMEEGKSFRFKGEKYRVYEKYRAYVQSVMGSLTYIARKGDSIYVVEALNPPFGIAYERSEDEIEYYLMEYLEPAEVYESFGVSAVDVERDNPLKPFSSPFFASLFKSSLIFFFISLAALAYIRHEGKGSVVENGYIRGRELKSTLQIRQAAPRLLDVHIYAGLDNEWKSYALELYDEDGVKIYSKNFELSYYHGYEDGESWSEGSDETDIYIRVQRPGKYILRVRDFSPSKRCSNHVVVREGVWRLRYFLIVFIMSIVGMLAYPLAYSIYMGRLWKDDE